MEEKYTHEEIARLAYELWERRAARSVRPKLIGTRRRVVWVCRIREMNSCSRVFALSQKSVPTANPEFSGVV